MKKRLDSVPSSQLAELDGEMSNSKDGILGWKSTIEGAAKVASISIV